VSKGQQPYVVTHHSSLITFITGWRARLIKASIWHRLRRGLRSATPFPIRRRLLNLVRGSANAELPVSDLRIPPSESSDIICFPIIDWSLRFQRPQQLLTQFARDGHRVFYVHTTFHQSGPSAFVQKLAENIYRVRLPGPKELDSLYKEEIDQPTLVQMQGALTELCQGVNIRSGLSLVQFPFWTRLALSCKEIRGWQVIYDCIDEHGGFRNVAPAVLQHEKSLIANSDLVLATSRSLYDKVKTTARRVVYLPNAADFEHFNRATVVQPLLVGHPVIGYYGAISEWFDTEMIRVAAASRPAWQFVLIGEVSGADVTRLEHLDNVHLLGELSYAVLPNYLHQFDVACIPFRLTPLTLATNPVKFFEYLSAGKPVVSVPLPELAPYRDNFYSVSSGEDLVAQVEVAIAEQSAEKTEARINFARENTWNHRYTDLKAALKSL
jgi:glycosyltransferase involved in cell wall biosynthesis